MSILLVGVFLAMILIPFLPGVLEVYFPRDRYPLPVDIEYSKDPRYLGKAAWRIVRKALGELKAADGIYDVQMSKPERIEVSENLTLAEHDIVSEIQYVRGDLRAGDCVRLANEIYVGGAARVGAAANLRAVACEGSITLGYRTRIGRWLDADGDISCGEQCFLGANAACGGELSLGDGSEFVRLMGAPVTTAGYLAGGRSLPDQDAVPLEFGEKIKTVEDILDLHRGDMKIAAGEKIEGSLIVKGDLIVGENVVITGAVRAYGRVTLGANSTVLGGVFSEDRIVVGNGAAVLGNVFSQEIVELCPGSRIGRPDGVKSVIGKRAIRLGQDVCVWGYLLTEGRGRVECRRHS